jgi:glucan phosphoethanolaminetransferase (alkaline phosphatase superfamily)
MPELLGLTLILCGIIFLLFMCLIVSIALKRNKTRLFLGLLMSALSIIAMILFIIVQDANGNPDAGNEILQLYLPISVFVVFITIGFVSSIKLVKK